MTLYYQYIEIPGIPGIPGIPMCLWVLAYFSDVAKYGSSTARLVYFQSECVACVLYMCTSQSVVKILTHFIEANILQPLVIMPRLNKFSFLFINAIVSVSCGHCLPVWSDSLC